MINYLVFVNLIFLLLAILKLFNTSPSSLFWMIKRTLTLAKNKRKMGMINILKILAKTLLDLKIKPKPPSANTIPSILRNILLSFFYMKAHLNEDIPLNFGFFFDDGGGYHFVDTTLSFATGNTKVTLFTPRCTFYNL